MNLISQEEKNKPIKEDKLFKKQIKYNAQANQTSKTPCSVVSSVIKYLIPQYRNRKDYIGFKVKTTHSVGLYFLKVAQLLLTPEVYCFILVSHFILMSYISFLEKKLREIKPEW